MPQYSWNTAKVYVKHQSINQSINQSHSEMQTNVIGNNMKQWIGNFMYTIKVVILPPKKCGDKFNLQVWIQSSIQHTPQLQDKASLSLTLG